MDLVGLLKFVEAHCADEQLYMVLPLKKGGEEEILWRRSEKTLPWAVRGRYEGASWWRFDAEKLPAALERRDVSLEALEQELRATVQLHITQAQLLLRDARAVMGDDAVDYALESYDAFAAELSSAIQAVLGIAEPEPETHTERATRGHLRLLVRD